MGIVSLSIFFERCKKHSPEETKWIEIKQKNQVEALTRSLKLSQIAYELRVLN